MKVVVAHGAGFCFGVKRAMSMASVAADEFGKVNSLGPLIHNPREIARLADKIEPISHLDYANSQVVIIRTHGVGPHIYADADEKNINIIDATCPFVRKAQKIAAEGASDGKQMIIVGDKEHPEVSAIVNWSEDRAVVVANSAELADIYLNIDAPIGVVAQTTQKREIFNDVISALKELGAKDISIYDTICHATVERQEEVKKMAKIVDAVIVIGGKNSANTKHLAQLAENYCSQVYLCEGISDLPLGDLIKLNTVGVCAGASTPDWIIEEVVAEMSELNKDNDKTQELKDSLKEVGEAAGELKDRLKDVASEKLAHLKENASELFEEIKEEASEKIAELKEEASEKMEELKEVLVEEEMSFEEAINGQMQKMFPGARMKGIVAQVKNEEILVDIGGKSEALLTSHEMTKDDAENIKERFAVGQEIDVVLIRKENKEGYPLVSKKRVDQELLWDKVLAAKEAEEPITGKVIEVVKGGVLVDAGVRGFVPASLVDTRFVSDLNTLVGKELTMKIIDCERRKNKLVLSARAYLEEQSAIIKEAAWEKIVEGETVTGTVRRLANFGAFVDLNGVDGLLHVSEIAWYHINKPSDILKEGQEVEVVIISADKETGKISLSMKKLAANPWDNVSANYPVDSIVPVTIMRTAPFGAFAQIEPGLEGLIHISHIDRKHIDKVEDALKAGDVVNVKVIAIDEENKKISLSIRETLPKLEVAHVEEVIDEENTVELVQESLGATIADAFNK